MGKRSTGKLFRTSLREYRKTEESVSSTRVGSLSDSSSSVTTVSGTLSHYGCHNTLIWAKISSALPALI